MKAENLAIFQQFSCRKSFRFARFQQNNQLRGERESSSDWGFSILKFNNENLQSKQCNLIWHVWFGWGIYSLTTQTKLHHQPNPYSLSLSLYHFQRFLHQISRCVFLCLQSLQIPQIPIHLYWFFFLILDFFFNFYKKGFLGLVNRL